jgi:hypothetical protein
VNSQAQNGAIVLPDQLLESAGVAQLRLANQQSVVYTAYAGCGSLLCS